MKEILAYICTKNRYQDYLPMAIMSVAMQTMKPDKLIIFDDNDNPINIWESSIGRHLDRILTERGIEHFQQFGAKKGQHYSHQTANKMGYKYCWRVDDDNFPESNVLENIYNAMTDDVGAVGGSILTPPTIQGGSCKMEDIYTKPNKQWGYISEVEEVDHLHDSFLYRSGITDYNLGLSKKAFREETLFTMGLKLEGYKLLIIPNTITWHLKSDINSSSGSTNKEDEELYKHDENIFRGHLQFGKIFVLNNGLGDHICFKSILPELKKKYPKYTLAVCYPELFEGERLISIADAQLLFGEGIENFNIYSWMDKNNWNKELSLAFKTMYLGQ